MRFLRGLFLGFLLLAVIGAISAIGLLHDEAFAIVVSVCLLAAAFAGLGLQRLSGDLLQAVQPTLPAVAPTHQAPAVPGALLRELESLRAMQHDLLDAKQAAEAATMAKGEFLATMSHEIRTPLNGIIPLLDLLLSTQLQPDQRDYLATAHRSALELLRIVDDILDYSKLEASKLALENVGINLKELVDSVAHLMERNASTKGLKLSVAIDPAVRLAVRGDPVRLRQVLTNLVSNAIKFTERGSVTIQLGKRGESRDHHDIMFAVRDTGIGLGAQAVEKLFQPFSQADASTTRLHGGTGLGLVISKRLVDLMHGQIGVHSEFGQGSVFWFNVPLQKALGDVRQRRDLEGVRSLLLSADDAFTRRLGRMLGSLGMQMQTTRLAAETLSQLRASAGMAAHFRPEVLLIDQESVRASTAALLHNVLRDPALNHLRILSIGNEDGVRDPRNASRMHVLAHDVEERDLRVALQELLGIDGQGVESHRPLLGMPDKTPEVPAETTLPRLTGRVLLVEDNPVNAKVAGRLLAMFGLEVDSAADGRMALDMIARHRYALVLMDCQMPVMDGYTATRERRAQEQSEGLAHLPIIAMTANAMAGDREKCLASGMDEYLTKPLDRHLLARTLAHWPGISSEAAVDRTPTPHRTGSAATQAPLITGEASAKQDAIERSVVEELIDLMGTDFSTLVNVYLEDAPRHVARLQMAVESIDLAAIIDSAHSLKSSSANLGAKVLADIAQRLERDARLGRQQDLNMLARRLCSELLRVQHALKAWSSG